ncbi:hypothetical protein BSFA1_80310 (plasmid) [Burkholderia sp. SFA1]|nr:hypothetical protein BYI23_E001310 [Burkholderia sp. YI23]BBQ02903.1 hypothetical protein BSFA1_80310 [Burkholderia sp. SFA1]
MTDDEIQLMLIQDPVQGRLLVCEVPNEIVLSGNSDRLAAKFAMIGEGGTHLSSNAGKLLVGISGYDADPRELYQIDEVGAFIRDLTKRVPWWIALLHPTLTLTWVCCLIPKPQIQRKEAGSLMVKIDNEAVEAVLVEAIKRAADRMFELDLAEEDAETLLQNLTITANGIMQGIDPTEADPFISKALRDYHQQFRNH